MARSSDVGGRTCADFALRIVIVDSQVIVVSGAMELGFAMNRWACRFGRFGVMELR